MAFCTSCGTKNEDIASYCSGCGKPITHPNPSPLSQHDTHSTPSPSSTESITPDEASIKKQKMKDRGFIGSLEALYNLIFIEKDIHELWKAYLGLTIVNALLNLLLYYFDAYGHGADIELKYAFLIMFIIVGILNICVKQGVSARNEYWVLAALIITVSLFLIGQIPSDDGISDYDVIFNVFSNPHIHGGLGKLYTFLAMLWDTLLGNLVEILLLVRIIFVIRALKR